MELLNEAYNSVNHYFNLLRKMGYRSYNEVNKLLVFIFIQELLDGDMSYYITEEDYNTINSALYCLYGTCSIPYPSYRRSLDSIVNKLPDKYRVTSNGTLRGTQEGSLRTIS